MDQQQTPKRKVVAIPIEEDTSSDSEPPSPSPSPPPKRKKMAEEPDMYPDRSSSSTPVYKPRSPSPIIMPINPETGRPQILPYSTNDEKRARSSTPHPLEKRETPTTLKDENEALKKEIETLKQENENLKSAIIKLAVAN